jgi:hypothetical protein
VAPDDYPRPPESVFAKHSRRRRILLHFQDALESAPREQDDGDIVLDYDNVISLVLLCNLVSGCVKAECITGRLTCEQFGRTNNQIVPH